MKKLFLGILFSFSFISSASAVPVQASKVLISAHCPYATEAAMKIAQAGGNPVDVALTAILTMAVTNPSFASLGGGGFALLKMDDDIRALDFREMAPSATGPDYYKDKSEKASTQGGAAIGVPGLPAGLYELHKKYGRIHWSRLFDEPIQLAQKGFRVTGGWSDDTKSASKDFNASAKKYFMKKSSQIYKPGELLKQPQLAEALKEMRNRKVVAFYNGRIGKDIIDSVKKAGGHMTKADLRNYKVKWRNPITELFRGYKIHLMPPPSSGGIVLQTALRLVTPLKLEETSERSADEFHTLAEIFRRAFRGRMLLGDPDFHTNPSEKLLSAPYIKKLAESFDDDDASELEPISMKSLNEESNETSHISVINNKGQAVSITITANGNYGSKVATDKYGIILNNQMDDFNTKPGQPNQFGLIQGKGNLVQAGKRPLSSMSPTLVEKDGKIILALGGRGGPRIISSVFQVLYRVLVRNNDIDTAIQTARVHHQFLPNKIIMDVDRTSPEVVKELKSRDHIVEQGWQGRVYGVMTKDGVLEGAFDSRREGSVRGF